MPVIVKGRKSLYVFPKKRRLRKKPKLAYVMVGYGDVNGYMLKRRRKAVSARLNRSQLKKLIKANVFSRKDQKILEEKFHLDKKSELRKLRALLD